MAHQLGLQLQRIRRRDRLNRRGIDKRGRWKREHVAAGIEASAVVAVLLDLLDDQALMQPPHLRRPIAAPPRHPCAGCR